MELKTHLTPTNGQPQPATNYLHHGLKMNSKFAQNKSKTYQIFNTVKFQQENQQLTNKQNNN